MLEKYYMIKLILSMNICGTLPLLLCVMIRKILGDRADIKKCYVLLMISALFYIIPYPLQSNVIRNFFYNISPKAQILWINGLSVPAFDISDTAALSKAQAPLLSWIFLALWIAGAVFNFLRMVLSYRKLRLQNHAMAEHDHTISIPFMLWNRKIDIRSSNYYDSAFSTGLLHPVIVLPKELKPEEKGLIELHELAHIKHLDFLLICFALFIRSLYWFNPFTYLLLQEIKDQQEFLADEWAVNHLDNKQIVQYGVALINSAPLRKRTKSAHYVSTFTIMPQKNTKERIMRLKNHMKNKPQKSFLILLAIVLTFVINSFTAAAYQLPADINASAGHKKMTLNGDFHFTAESVENSDDTYTFVSSDIYFIDENGQRLPVCDDQIIENDYTRSCSHVWRDGKLEQHVKNSDRSCDVITYKAKQGIICGDVTIISRISTTHYNKCPH